MHTPRHLSEAGGVETRRSARLFPSSQDSENFSTVVAVRELRGTSRSQQSTLSGGTSSRTTHDKQLRFLLLLDPAIHYLSGYFPLIHVKAAFVVRTAVVNMRCLFDKSRLVVAQFVSCRSMNRINEMEVNNVAIKVRRPSPVSTPSLHKLIESPDSDSSTKATSPVSRRTRSGSQSAASPLSDKNAQFKVSLGLCELHSIKGAAMWHRFREGSVFHSYYEVLVVRSGNNSRSLLRKIFEAVGSVE